MRTLIGNLSSHRWLAAATASVALCGGFAPMHAWAAEAASRTKPIRALTGTSMVTSITAARPSSLPSHAAAAVPTTVAPMAPAPAALPMDPGAVMQECVRNAWAPMGLASQLIQGSLLGWAVESRREPLIDWMLGIGMNPNACDFQGFTPLQRAVQGGELRLVNRLLAVGTDPDARGSQHPSPLMLAAEAGHLEIVQLLVQGGAQVDLADAKGWRPLHYALAKRRAAIMNFLLAANASVATPEVFPLVAESRDWTLIGPILECSTMRTWDAPARLLLDEAIRAKQVDHLRLLLTKHRGPATLEGTKDPLLAYAVVRNDLALVQLLLQAGADPNTILPGKPEERLLQLVPYKTLKHYLAEEPGMTLMNIAAGMGHVDMLKLLLANGAEKNRATKSKYRLVPLYFAAWGNHVKCLQALIENSPAPNQMRIEISLTGQQATLYKNDVAIFRTEISSGQSEKPTPTGQFVVTDKKRHHVSNLYEAKMPFFMRLSCKDFGMHEGHLPGYPASHGCIRLSNEAARKLFREVPIGTLVTIR